MTRADTEQHVQSPCMGVCQLDARRICIGCFRTSAEITVWPYADPTLRREIVRAAGLRRQAGMPAKT
jgi:predicted Fe-S protein YdhL (DUF1289 family)